MSACFSCYKQLFAEGQEFTYDLKDLAGYYNNYVELMNIGTSSSKSNSIY